MHITEELKSSIIKELTRSLTAQSIGNLSLLYESRQAFIKAMVAGVPPGNFELKKIMTEVFEIALKKFDRQKEGDDLLSSL